MIELARYVQRLNSADEAERIYAAEDIGYTNRAEGVVPLLERLPVEASRAVREAIFTALENIEDVAVTHGAIGLLTSEDSFVRNQAVELLRRRGPRVISLLIRAFPRAGKDQRKMLVDVLAGVDGPGSSELYQLALADSDVNVVITAVEILGGAAKVEFREQVEQLASTGNPMLAGSCLEALAHIGNELSLQAIRRSVGPACDLPDFLLPSYLKLLGAHGSKYAIAEAAAMLDSRGAHLRASILGAITMLRQRHPSEELPASLVDPLEDIIRNSTSPLQRRQAIRLLGGLKRHVGVARFLKDCQETTPDPAAPGEEPGV
jgi:HEAT repeat protein